MTNSFTIQDGYSIMPGESFGRKYFYDIFSDIFVVNMVF